MVISRISKKRKNKKATAAEPPVLTPAAGLVSDKPASLYEFLRNSGYLIDRTSADLIQVALELPGMKALLLEGPPGVGKTALTEKIAQWLGADYIYVLATPNTDEDALLYKFVPDENTKSGIRVAEGPLTQAVKKAAAGKKVVLVIDEFDKTRPSTDALLLDLLQNGRVTLYLGGKEDVLVADPDNLYVFLTSNAMREFSEPLMRRLVRVDFELLDPSDVAELLKRRFDAQTANLLAEIYRDTVEAGLRKPATIQELLQLGYVLKKMPNAPLNRLLRMYVIKYEDDWEKFLEYLEQKGRQIAERRKEQALWAFGQQAASTQQSAQQEEAAPQSYVGRVLRGTSTELYTVADPSMQVADASGMSGGTYTFKAYMSEDIYTALAKMYPPGDTPEDLGKFKVVKVEGDRIIVSKEPLNLDEFFALYNGTSTGFEAYIEGKVWMVLPDDLDKLLNAAKTIKSYSKRSVLIASETDDVKEEVLIELSEPYPQSGTAKLVEATIKAYVLVNGLDESSYRRREPPILDRIYNDTIHNFCNKRLTYRNDIGKVAAGIAGICLESGTQPNLIIEASSDNIDDAAVNEIEKALTERLQPLGISVSKKKCSGGKYRGLYIDKRGDWNEVVIECAQ